MAKVAGKCKEVLDKAEWVAITSLGKDGPHTVATWGDHLLNMGLEESEVIVIPAGDYYKTEQNLKENGQVELLGASKQVEGSHFQGQGCRISGKGEFQSTGTFAAVAREKFPWARGALVIRAETANAQL